MAETRQQDGSLIEGNVYEMLVPLSLISPCVTMANGQLPMSGPTRHSSHNTVHMVSANGKFQQCSLACMLCYVGVGFVSVYQDDIHADMYCTKLITEATCSDREDMILGTGLLGAEPGLALDSRCI